MHILLPLLNLLGSSEAARGWLSGTNRTLSVSDAENQVLLHLEDLQIRDTYSTVGDAFEQNHRVYEHLDQMASKPYFSTYKVDLSDSRCPFEDDSATCANRQCAIEPLSSKDIDETLFRSQYLGRLRKNSVSREAPAGIGEDCAPASGSLYAHNTNRDYCYPEDESQESGGVWVDLNGNAERFTGYAGDHAHLMWSKVYEENCFGYYGENDVGKRSVGDSSASNNNKKLPSFSNDDDADDKNADAGSTAADQLALVFSNPNMETSDEWAVDHIPTEECVEQRLFYRLLSGMHASISTHLTYDWLNSTSGEWQSNLGEWLERVGWHEDRLNNLFFNYVLVSRSISKLVEVYERQLTFSSSCFTVDNEVRIQLRRLGRLLHNSPLYGAIDENQLFASPEGQALKTEFRRRVRNVNALMSCVGCERCRLWGKIQTAGYGTALKILFELPSNPADDEQSVAEVLSTFRRSELVALINTFARLTHSLNVVERFQYEAEGELIDQLSLKYQAKIAWTETMTALKFILRSYVDFPKNLYKIGLRYMNRYWNKFISGGQPVYTEIDLDEGFHMEL